MVGKTQRYHNALEIRANISQEDFGVDIIRYLNERIRYNYPKKGDKTMIDTVLEVEVNKPFGNLYRKATVLIAIKDDKGRYIFGCKQGYYPDGITRLIGGGVDEREAPIETAVREMKEEMGLDVSAHELIPLGKIKTIARTPERIFETVTYLFYFYLGSRTTTAGDDVTHFMFLDEKGFEELVRNYGNIQADLRQNADGEDYYWADYGKVYGEIHKLVLEELKAIGILTTILA